MIEHVELLSKLILDLSAILVVGVLLSFITGLINLNILEFLYLIWNRDFGHFLEKRNLVRGDLIFIDFRGTLKKATVTMNSKNDKSVQAVFDDNKMTTLNIEYNNYNYSRIYVPKYLSNASKILFAVRKEK